MTQPPARGILGTLPARAPHSLSVIIHPFVARTTQVQIAFSDNRGMMSVQDFFIVLILTMCCSRTCFLSPRHPGSEVQPASCLVPRLRMRGAIPQLHHVFMKRCLIQRMDGFTCTFYYDHTDIGLMRRRDCVSIELRTRDILGWLVRSVFPSFTGAAQRHKRARRPPGGGVAFYKTLFFPLAFC